jgi:hypothetical protein
LEKFTQDSVKRLTLSVGFGKIKEELLDITIEEEEKWIPKSKE